MVKFLFKCLCSLPESYCCNAEGRTHVKMHDLSFVDNDMEKEKMISNLIYLYISIGMEMSAVMRFIFCMHGEQYAVTQI